ncbi:MAG TPA: DUF4124 domain-containing protein [Chromatiaceae bacterium]|jgi:hypothetical protein|nr:MAG: hypothetical protein N838_16900 [Thiohalocapsa sp. PB-PSB1]HBG95854.1 DUF4124 domain-containing protein [Chromatiaceae bacterium]HCS88685.1 DUF4124 domain-containing protein [Chromatiaceae bacterium]
MHQQSARPLTGSQVARISFVLWCIIVHSASTAPASAQTHVYRCIAQDGSIEFSQRSCRESEKLQQIEIQDTQTGWTPPSNADSPASVPKKAGKKKAKSTTDHDAGKYADRCWKKRQQIERVNAELRAGYKTQRGAKLRRRRSEYEAFLRRFCR